MTHLPLILLLLPSGSEWIIIALLVLLLFGGKKIPELMRGLGKGVKSFKEGVNDAREEISKAKDELELSQKDHKVALIEAPGQGKEARREKKSLFEILFARGSEERRINIAFINDKTPETSRWTYAHSLGWTALNDKYGDEAEIQVYHGCDGPEKTEAALRQAVEAGAEVTASVSAGRLEVRSAAPLRRGRWCI